MYTLIDVYLYLGPNPKKRTKGKMLCLERGNCSTSNSSQKGWYKRNAQLCLLMVLSAQEFPGETKTSKSSFVLLINQWSTLVTFYSQSLICQDFINIKCRYLILLILNLLFLEYLVLFHCMWCVVLLLLLFLFFPKPPGTTFSFLWHQWRVIGI